MIVFIRFVLLRGVLQNYIVVVMVQGFVVQVVFFLFEISICYYLEILEELFKLEVSQRCSCVEGCFCYGQCSCFFLSFLVCLFRKVVVFGVMGCSCCYLVEMERLLQVQVYGCYLYISKMESLQRK